MGLYLIVTEKTGAHYYAYCPDLPGCAATGATREEVWQRMEEVIKLRLEGRRQDHRPIPPVKSVAEYISLES